MNPLWSLPGPDGFLRHLVDALHAGENAVLCLPAVQPPGLADALEQAVRDSRQREFLSLPIGSHDRPIRALLATAGPGSGKSSDTSVETLVANNLMQGQIVWVNGITPATWSVWQRFLGNYAQASRAEPPHARATFVVPLVGEMALDPPVEDVGLRHHRWQGVLGELDMLVFAVRVLHHREISPGMRTLLAWTLAKVGLWDAELVSRLADAPPQHILNPQQVLRKLAEERGWTSNTPLEWWRGTSERFDGLRSAHSGLLLLRGDERRLHERLWRAQVATALPVVEMRRQELLDEGRGYLRPPFQIDARAIEDPDDLEVGTLPKAFQQAGAPWSLVRRAKRLRDVRNLLAHRKCVEAAELVELMNGRAT